MNATVQHQNTFINFLESLRKLAVYLEAIEIILRFLRIPLILLALYLFARFNYFPTIDWPKRWWWLLDMVG
jgi:hypothetical protein